MADEVSWGVGQRVEYAAKYLEKGKYPICKPAVDHFIGIFRNRAVDAAQAAGVDAALLEQFVNKAAYQTALDAHEWAVENHPWYNITGQASQGLSALANGKVVTSGVKGGQELTAAMQKERQKRYRESAKARRAAKK